MKYNYQPKSKLEKFGVEVCATLVENFSDTYLVGGTVRDMLLGKKITDVDIATSAVPEQVADVLRQHFIEFNAGYMKLGVMLAMKDSLSVSVSTFRREKYSGNRYPSVRFTKQVKLDAARRDLTINALYFGPKTGKITDFQGGLKDLKSKSIRFVGEPGVKIKEDPLRIVRALRFALSLNFKLETRTREAIKKYSHLLSELTRSRIAKETEKLNSEKNKKILNEVINNPKLLDKYF